MTNPDPPSRPGRSPLPWVLGLVAAVVVAAAVVAVLVVGGGDDDDGTDGAPAGPPITLPRDTDTTDTDTTAGDTTAGPGDDATPGVTDDRPNGVTGSGDDPRLPPEVIGEVGDVVIEGEALSPFPVEGPDPAIGDRPPLLVAGDVDGSVYTISPDIDGPVMLVFLAHWCPACNEEVPHLVELEQAGRLPADLTVFGVLTSVAPDRPNFPPSQWVVDRGWPWPAVADGVDFDREPPQWAAASAFGLTAYPYVVLIDDGVVVDRWSGSLGTDGLAARIDAAVG